MNVVVLISFAADTWRTAPETFVAILGILALSVGLDGWTRSRGRETPHLILERRP